VLERAPAAAGAPAAVLWIAGPNPRLVPLGTGRTTLGRDPDNDVILEDDRVSGTHGFVFLKPDGAHYIDASRNGSVVDGEPILGESRPLRHGSVVALGGARVALLLVPAETVAALAATS
jgi:pSer/pThr/pTyr-binding forkhead associated (FHA) protein